MVLGSINPIHVQSKLRLLRTVSDCVKHSGTKLATKISNAKSREGERIKHGWLKARQSVVEVVPKICSRNLLRDARKLGSWELRREPIIKLRESSRRKIPRSARVAQNTSAEVAKVNKDGRHDGNYNFPFSPWLERRTPDTRLRTQLKRIKH